MDPQFLLPLLLGTAVLLPLVSFFVILAAGPRMGKAGEKAGYVAVSAIGGAALLSFIALGVWLRHHWPAEPHEPAPHAAVQGNVVLRGQDPAHAGDGEQDDVRHAPENGHDHQHAAAQPKPVYTDEFNVPGTQTPWLIGQFGHLRVSLSYYIDTLTITMFCMVTFIATLIHIYSIGYMHEELHDVTDHEVTTADGSHLHRPGRYPRFFQYLSLFSFSMLGLVIAGNIAMVFVFWELVGICSYFLIGFYVERKSASNAANKAFIVNRVGDFGMIIGLMALWTSLGTFSFGDYNYTDPYGNPRSERGIFSQVRAGEVAAVPDGMVLLAAREEAAELAAGLPAGASQAEVDAAIQAKIPEWRSGDNPQNKKFGYGLLVLAGIGIFAGCVGKSAQFPLHVWLPDAMEGPTPVSALVHSATMVAAGVYLVGRFFPVFAPEVLLVIAVTGCITLFLAASIAITATDIKRVLAYSTVSQLGYMMMALGVGGWLAGMMHLITHAFFKSLLFLCSGSVIHAVHSNEMTDMGGLRKKMPVTAYTMLIGCLAIAGAGVPFLAGMFGGKPLTGVGLSGFYSKDAILEQAYSFLNVNGSTLAGAFFVVAAGGAAITAFYMFRLWYMTFAGQPRDPHRYEHAHESPPAMYVPLVILAVMAVAVAWSPIQGVIGALVAFLALAVWKFTRRAAAPTLPHGDAAAAEHGPSRINLADVPLVLALVVLVVAAVWLVTPDLDRVVLAQLLEQARPEHTAATTHGGWLTQWTWPDEHLAHEPHIVVPVSLIAIGTAFAGFFLATCMYGLGWLNPDEARRQFQPVYRLLWNKWWFDELYDWLFVRPAHVVSRCAAAIDKRWIDWLIDGLAWWTARFAAFWDRLADQSIVDGLVNLLASWTYSLGASLRSVQTGSVRQYVMFIVIGAVAISLLISFFWNQSLAG